MQLTSLRNPLIQSIRRAAAAGRCLDDGRIVIEGPHLVAEVLRSPWRLEQVLVSPTARERHAPLLAQIRAEVIELSPRVFDSLAQTETSQEMMALVSPAANSFAECLAARGSIIVLDGIQDPGNAGTIVRSAEAFGAAGLIFLEGGVSLANGKFLRATAGSVFRLPCFFNQPRAGLLDRLQNANRRLYALMPQATLSLSRADLRGPCAIAVGSEAHGVSAEWRAAAEGLRIPTSRVESLNAAIACSIVLFEAARQAGEV